MATQFDVITLGYIFEETIQSGGRSAGPFLGGTVSYSALCLGKLGVRVGIVSNISDDTPKTFLEPFPDAGVDTAGLNRRAGATITKNILKYDSEGNKTIEYLTRAPVIEFEDIPENYLDAKSFYLCPVDYEIAPACAAKLRSLGAIIAADMGGFGGAHCSDGTRRTHAGRVRQYMETVDIAKASLEDCSYIFPAANVDDPKQAAERLLDLGGEVVIITLGERGALIRTQQESFWVSAIKTDVVDCTGAGDIFTSAFLAEYLASADIEMAGIFASATASLLIERTGGASLERVPGREAVIDRASKHGYRN